MRRNRRTIGQFERRPRLRLHRWRKRQRHQGGVCLRQPAPRAIAAANPTGTVTVGSTRHFWAAPFEIGKEFGGLGLPSPWPDDAQNLSIRYRNKAHAGANTTIAVIATDAVLTKPDAKRLAIAAHDGFARAIWPAHTPVDGDLVFGLATGRSGIKPTPDATIDLYAAAGAKIARAIARAVYAATPAEGDLIPVWSGKKP